MEKDETFVREEIITPLLKYLSYSNFTNPRIERNKTLKNKFVQIGSKRKAITSYPDYCIYYNDVCHLVIEAKNPRENPYEHTMQAYYYSIHPEINSRYFALCNGFKFILYSRSATQPLLEVNILDEDSAQLDKLSEYIGAKNIFLVTNTNQEIFINNKVFIYENLDRNSLEFLHEKGKYMDFWYGQSIGGDWEYRVHTCCAGFEGDIEIRKARQYDVLQVKEGLVFTEIVNVKEFFREINFMKHNEVEYEPTMPDFSISYWELIQKDLHHEFVSVPVEAFKEHFTKHNKAMLRWL